MDQIKEYDCIVIGTKHEYFDYKKIEDNAELIVDLQNAYKKECNNIYKL